jgi:ABC-type hemin transport system ATPase subunit
MQHHLIDLHFEVEVIVGQDGAGGDTILAAACQTLVPKGMKEYLEGLAVAEVQRGYKEGRYGRIATA